MGATDIADVPARRLAAKSRLVRHAGCEVSIDETVAETVSRPNSATDRAGDAEQRQKKEGEKRAKGLAACGLRAMAEREQETQCTHTDFAARARSAAKDISLGGTPIQSRTQGGLLQGSDFCIREA